MIEFFMPMNPPTATAQQKGLNKNTGAIFTSLAIKQTKNTLKAGLNPYRPSEPLQGALTVASMWVFPLYKKDLKNYDGGLVPHTNKPDCDNMVKVLLDCMTDMNFWNDDSQIVHLAITKVRTDEPGIFMSIGRYGE